MRRADDADRVIAEVRRELDDMRRAFWDQICSIAPGSDARLVDFAALERAQLDAFGRDRRARARAIVEHGAALVFATPRLSAQRKWPN